MNEVIVGPGVWWALSLGVLAGSSATLTGATAGPIVASQLEAYNQQSQATARTSKQQTRALDLSEYLSWGVPIWVTFLLISSLYIFVIRF